MKCPATKIDCMIEPLRKLANKIGAPLLDLAFRLYVAQVFFKSGMLRLQSALNGDWGTQIFLFDMEHPVPYMSPEIAAVVTTAGELALPVLLALGLFSRFGAAGLFAMALMIQLTYMHSAEHLLWMALMASIFIKGPGVLSLDFLMLKWLRQGKTDCPACDSGEKAETAEKE